MRIFVTQNRMSSGLFGYSKGAFPMIRYERHQKILDILEKKPTASIKELSSAVYASEASVRRDIAALDQMGYVKRIYGGVVLSKYKNSIVPVELRDTDNSGAKELVARRAAELIFDGATVLTDASSTVRRMIKYIDRNFDVKIITNNQRIFSEAGTYPFTFYCTGGIYIKENHNFLGPAAQSYLRSVRADLAFFSSQGISEDGEITDVSEEETEFRRVMISRAEKSYFLCDSSKLGVKKTFTLCKREEITDVICDQKLPWE